MRTKVKGLVIREKPNGESGKLLTLLTDSGGVITVNAKGVRKISAAFLKSAQLFAFSDMLLYEKNGFYTLTEASLITDFYSIREDISSYALACYVCDAASAFAVPGEESGKLLRLALNTLYAIENKTSPLRQIKAAFELRLCTEGGFAPETDRCGECGEEIEGSCAFVLADGVALCRNCAQSGGDALIITEPVRMAISHIVNCELQKFLSFRIGDADLRLLSECAERFFLLRAERGFSTLSFYKQCEEL